MPISPAEPWTTLSDSGYLRSFFASCPAHAPLAGCSRLPCVSQSSASEKIESFTPREYWSAFVALRTAHGAVFRAGLVELEGQKIGRFGLPDEASARVAERILKEADVFEVESVEAKPVRQKPAAPFITSTLQQEASRKLRLSAAQTMRSAQTLYEAGLITYMRTDGVDMAPEAVSATRALVVESYGSRFVPKRERRYRSRAKNAQEAHECIRPTDPRLLPDQLPRLPAEQKDLYRLIWARTVASQMADAELERTTVGVNALASGDAMAPASVPPARLRASGQVVRFEGFRILYQEGTDSSEEESGESDEQSVARRDPDRRLPPLSRGDRPERDGDPEVQQHFTKPPARFTEASLVRRLEDLGIGRPSTYATILTVIRKRGYVEDSKRTIIPTFLGRLAVGFLEAHFSRYVQYDFTAELERELDEISGGRATRTGVLEAFWNDFEPAVAAATKLGVREAISGVEAVVEPVLFPPRSDGVDPRVCPKCLEGRLALRPGRSSLFLGCDRYPDCRFVRSLEAAAEGEPDWLGDRDLGKDESGRHVLVRKGPFGYYLELGTLPPRRASLPPGSDPYGIDLATAQQYLALPRALGAHPETGDAIEVGIGRYGPFVRCGTVYANLPKDESVLEVGLNRAVALIADREARRGRGRSAPALRELGGASGRGSREHTRWPLRAVREVGQDIRVDPEDTGSRPRHDDGGAGVDRGEAGAWDRPDSWQARKMSFEPGYTLRPRLSKGRMGALLEVSASNQPRMRSIFVPLRRTRPSLPMSV